MMSRAETYVGMQPALKTFSYLADIPEWKHQCVCYTMYSGNSALNIVLYENVKELALSIR